LKLNYFVEERNWVTDIWIFINREKNPVKITSETTASWYNSNTYLHTNLPQIQSMPVDTKKWINLSMNQVNKSMNLHFSPLNALFDLLHIWNWVQQECMKWPPYISECTTFQNKCTSMYLLSIVHACCTTMRQKNTHWSKVQEYEQDYNCAYYLAWISRKPYK